MHLYKSQVVFFNIGKYTVNQHEQTMKNCFCINQH